MTKFVVPACVRSAFGGKGCFARLHSRIDRAGASVFFLAQLLLISHTDALLVPAPDSATRRLASGCSCVVDKTRGKRNVKGVVRKGLV
jgi:hypothetical protein